MMAHDGYVYEDEDILHLIFWAKHVHYAKFN